MSCCSSSLSVDTDGLPPEYLRQLKFGRSERDGVSCVAISGRFDGGLAGGCLTLECGATSVREGEAARGVPHLLEHLAFAASALWPAPGGFRTFVSSHGGSSNASTGDFRTVFWFVIRENALTEALSRLVDAIYRPVLPRGQLETETRAVCQEFLGEVDSHEVAVLAILKSLASPESKWHDAFICGNETSLLLSQSSLRDADKSDRQTLLLEQVKKFHRNYWLPTRKSLVVVGNDSTSDLLKSVKQALNLVTSKSGTLGFVKRAFSRSRFISRSSLCLFRRRGKKERSVLSSLCPSAFPDSVLPLCIFMESELGDRLEFRFVTSETRGQSTLKKCLGFLTHLIRSDHPGGLKESLRREGDVSGVFCARGCDGFGQAFYDVEFVLKSQATERLIEHLGNKLRRFFDFCLQESSTSLIEFSRLRKAHLQVATVPNTLTLARDACVALSDRLPLFDDLQPLDHTQVKAVLKSALSFERLILVVTTHTSNLTSLFSLAQANKQSSLKQNKYYGTLFIAVPAPPNWIRAWKRRKEEAPNETNTNGSDSTVTPRRRETSSPSSSQTLRRFRSSRKSFELPTPNRFLPSRFSIREKDGRTMRTPTQLTLDELHHPEKIQVYLHRHSDLNLPLAWITVRFYLSCLGYKTDEVVQYYRQGSTVSQKVQKALGDCGPLVRGVLGSILARAFRIRLEALARESSAAGLEFDLTTTSVMAEGQVGLQLEVGGFSETARHLFAEIFSHLLEGSLGLSELERARADVLADCECALSETDSDTLTEKSLNLILFPLIASAQQQRKLLGSLSTAQVAALIDEPLAAKCTTSECVHHQSHTPTHTQPRSNISALFEDCSIVVVAGGNIGRAELAEDWVRENITSPLMKCGVSFERTVEERGSLGRQSESILLDETESTEPITYLDLSALKSVQRFSGDIWQSEFAVKKEETADMPLWLFLFDSGSATHSTISIHIPLGSQLSPEDFGQAIILQQILEERFYTRIRDELQLTYYLSTDLKTVGASAQYLVFSVTSDQSPSVILQAMSSFLDEQAERSDQSDWHLERRTTALRDILKSEYTTLRGRHEALAQHVFARTYDYEQTRHIAQSLTELTAEKLLAYKSQLLTATPRLAIVAYQKEFAKTDQLGGTLYSIAIETKRELDLQLTFHRYCRLKSPRALHKLLLTNTNKKLMRHLYIFGPTNSHKQILQSGSREFSNLQSKSVPVNALK